MSFKHGESVKSLLGYWLPEVISVAILVYIPPLIDSYLISTLHSTTTFGALGMVSNFLHTIIKLGEAIPVAAIAIIGRHNGAHQYKKCGQDLGDTFWTTCIIGLFFFALVYFGAPVIFWWLGVPDRMAAVGVPFLRLRSFSILLIFTFGALVGFMKGVKNTRVPMLISVLGVITFLCFDYALILGKWGFPQCGLAGSALASLAQFIVLNVAAIAYIIFNPEYKKYFSKVFFMLFDPVAAYRLLNLSWPIMIDKSSLSLAYIILAKKIAPMGKYAIASFDMIKQLERFAFLPALGFASIITFLVSNRLGANDARGARDNIKKVILLATGMVMCSITFICFNVRYFISFFDTRGKWIDFAAPIVPIVSILVVFDLVQVILAGSLRGAGDVKTVMMGRFFTIFCFFIPLVSFISWLPIENMSVRFTLIYGSFYLSNGVMGFVFLRRIMGTAWQQKKLLKS